MCVCVAINLLDCAVSVGVCLCVCVCACITFMPVCTYQIDSHPLPLLSISTEVVDIHISDRGGLNVEDVAQLSGPLAGLMVA